MRTFLVNDTRTVDEKMEDYKHLCSFFNHSFGQKSMFYMHGKLNNASYEAQIIRALETMSLKEKQDWLIKSVDLPILFADIYQFGSTELVKVCLDTVPEKLTKYLNTKLYAENKRQYRKKHLEKMMLLMSHPDYITNEPYTLMGLLCATLDLDIMRFGFEKFLPNPPHLVEEKLFEITRGQAGEQEQQMMEYFILERNFTPKNRHNDLELINLLEKRNLNQSLKEKMSIPMMKNRAKI